MVGQRMARRGRVIWGLVRIGLTWRAMARAGRVRLDEALHDMDGCGLAS